LNKTVVRNFIEQNVKVVRFGRAVLVVKLMLLAG